MLKTLEEVLRTLKIHVKNARADVKNAVDHVKNAVDHVKNAVGQAKDGGLSGKDAGLDAINACSGVRDGERRVRDAEPWSEDPMVEVQLASNSKSGKVPSASIIVLNIGILKNGTVTSSRASGQGRRPNHARESQCSAMEGGLVPDTCHPW